LKTDFLQVIENIIAQRGEVPVSRRAPLDFATMALVMRGASAAREDFAILVGTDVADEQIDLLAAGFAIARIEYPDLNTAEQIHRVDQLAMRVKRLVRPAADPRDIVLALNHVLFEVEAFRGNRDDYYDPLNSFLNDVLDRKVGIPITLSILYMEVARRVGFPMSGVGMPGHFLLKYYDIDGRDTLIDVYENGRIVSPADCQSRLDQIYSGQVPLQPDFLQPVGRRQILTRVLNNLKSIYLNSRNFRKALPVVDLILTIYPRSPEDVKARALLRYSVGQLRGSVEDFEDYLKMSPEASDADEIRQTALSIRRTMANMN
jgi:regulator of sirC expression with transglutaminase-like and TPR domain